MTITVGAQASAAYAVTADDTAISMGSGDVPVLGTPRLLAWCEAVTVAALAPGLEEGSTSVGYRVHLDHLLPTPVGGTVRIQATVSAVDGRQVTFAVTADDDAGTAAEATVIRVVVDRQRFIDRLS